MSTKLKALGLALLASLALGAVGVVNAGATSGGHFTSEADWTIFDAQQEHPPDAPTGVLLDTGSGAEVECAVADYEASAGNQTVSAVTVAAEFKQCATKGFLTAGAVVNMNGCDFLLTVGPNPATQDQTVHLKCPTTTDPHKKDEVVIVIDPPLFGTCTVHIPEQTSTSGGVVYTPHTVAEGKKGITIDLTAIGITQNKTEQGFGCLGSGGEDNATDLIGSVTVEGQDTGGEPVDIVVEGYGETSPEEETHEEETHNPGHVEEHEIHTAHTAHTAETAHTAHTAHTKTTEEEQIEFNSEVEHTLYTGDDVTANGFKFGELFGSVKCEQTTYVGTGTKAKADSITIEPTYSECEGLNRQITTHMHGCGFVLELTGEGGDGPVKIECPGEKVIETTYDAFAGGCTITIGPQTAGGTVDYEEQGSGSTRDLLITWTLKEIHYVRDGCEFEGTATNGTYSGSVTLKGENTSEEQKGIWIE